MISHIAVLLPQLSTLMYMERLEEREAVIRSFTLPQIQSAIFLSYFSPSNTQTHIPQCTISPASPPAPQPPPFIHPHSGSSCHHLSSSATPEKPIQTAAPHRHGMLAKGDGVLSGSRLQPPSLPPTLLPPLLPLRCFSTFPQHAWCISRVARLHDRAAPENRLELFCTLCDLLKFRRNCMWASCLMILL